MISQSVTPSNSHVLKTYGPPHQNRSAVVDAGSQSIKDIVPAPAVVIACAAGLHRILDAVPAGAYTCDTAGLITYFSPLAETIWGRAPKLRNLADRYCGSFKLYWSNGMPMRHDECWMAQTLRAGARYNGREVLIERPDGTRTLGLAYANPMHNQKGKIIGAVNLIFGTVAHKQLKVNQQKTQGIRAVPHDAALAMLEIVLGISALATMT